jgi:hypothetical protein
MSHGDTEFLTIGLSNGEPIKFKMIGEITDKIYKNGILVEERTGHNIIVNQFLKLVMALCKGEANYKGIQYWAIGSGEASWDTSMPNPEINAARLTTELGRVAILPAEITFLDATGAVSATPTGVLQIKHTFGPNDCNGKWREFGIFGGNATSVANSGLMINKKHHAVITKTNEMSIERTMKFTLSLI